MFIVISMKSLNRTTCVVATTLWSALIPLGASGFARAQELAPITEITSPPQLNFTTAMLRDRRGPLWVGTEDNGVWRYDPAAPKASAWKQFGAKDGLGDDEVYALAQDEQNRIWVGHAWGGVSVWNGKSWGNYNRVPNAATGTKAGPLGERVFDIAINPFGGAVWMATDAGISIYDPRANSWSYLTRHDGLPSDQIQCIAFSSLGHIFVGTQSDGLAIGSIDNLAQWRTVAATSGPLDTVVGSGLPSGAINDVLVTPENTVFVATKNGLARSDDLGDSWDYLRGSGWDERAKGRTVALAPKPWPDGFSRFLLREDYVTGLNEDNLGLLYVSYRQRGWEVRRPINDHVPYDSKLDYKADGDFPYLSATLPQAGAPALLGFYQGGVKLAEPLPAFVPTPEERAAFAQRDAAGGNTEATWLPFGQTPLLPAGAKAPTLDEIDARMKPLSGLDKPLAVGGAYYEADDWETRGDWMGHYGRDYAVLCATQSPLNHYVQLDTDYQVDGFIGPHIKDNDSLRHWVHWVQTENFNTLYNPVIGYRRQAEWDDHGEAYPFSWEGPDLWARVQVPEGVHRMSLYFFNKDGHVGFNRARDYALEVYGDGGIAEPKAQIAALDAATPLASSRVRDFWNGVFKRFIVRGPATYWVKVARDGSFNTILSSVMLDKISGPATWTQDRGLAYLGRTNYDAPDWKTMSYEGADWEATVQRARIWEWKLDAALGREGGAAASDGLRVLALRALMDVPAGQMPPQLLERWRWKNQIWTDKDRQKWSKAMADGRESWFEMNPHVRNVEF